MPGPLELIILTVIAVMVFTPFLVIGVVVLLAFKNRKPK